MTDHSNPPAYTQLTSPPLIQASHTAEHSAPLNAVTCNGVSGQNPPVMAIQAGYPFPTFAYPSFPTVYGSYLSKRSRSLGILQIVLGALCIVINAVGIGLNGTLTYVAVGIWGGALFIVSGAFGISAAKLRTKCKITTFLILSIISASTTIALFICAVLGAVFQDDGYFHGHRHYDYYDTTMIAAIAMNSVLAILAVTVAIAAIWGSVLGCKVYGCCSGSSDNQQPMMQGQPMMHGQPMMQGQFSTMQGGQPLIVIPMAQLSFAGQMAAYTPGYTSQQTVAVSVPPYPPNYGQSVVPLVSQTHTAIIENEEKQPLE